jgi:hypothetical protein
MICLKIIFPLYATFLSEQFLRNVILKFLSYFKELENLKKVNVANGDCTCDFDSENCQEILDRKLTAKIFARVFFCFLACGRRKFSSSQFIDIQEIFRISDLIVGALNQDSGGS